VTLERLLAWAEGRVAGAPKLLEFELRSTDAPGWWLRAAMRPVPEVAVAWQREPDDGGRLVATADALTCSCGPSGLTEATAKLLDAAGLPEVRSMTSEAAWYERSPLSGLAAWFAWRCDGDWELDCGVALEWLAGGDWQFTVDVAGTALGACAETAAAALPDGVSLEADRFTVRCASHEVAWAVALFGWLARGEWQDPERPCPRRPGATER
jgi:hypothetical protein